MLGSACETSGRIPRRTRPALQRSSRGRPPWLPARGLSPTSVAATSFAAAAREQLRRARRSFETVADTMLRGDMPSAPPRGLATRLAIQLAAAAAVGLIEQAVALDRGGGGNDGYGGGGAGGGGGGGG